MNGAELGWGYATPFNTQAIECSNPLNSSTCTPSSVVGSFIVVVQAETLYLKGNIAFVSLGNEDDALTVLIYSFTGHN